MGTLGTGIVAGGQRRNNKQNKEWRAGATAHTVKGVGAASTLPNRCFYSEVCIQYDRVAAGLCRASQCRRGGLGSQRKVGGRRSSHILGHRTVRGPDGKTAAKGQGAQARGMITP